MCPPSAFNRRMRVAILVGKLVVNSMCCHPENRAAFQRQRCADREAVLEPSRNLVAAMREQAVVAHSDSQARGYPPQSDCNEKSCPCEVEQRDYRKRVEDDHHARRHPIDSGIVLWFSRT